MIYGIFLCTLFGLIVAIGFAIVGSQNNIGKWDKNE